MKIENLRELFEATLPYAYDCEQKLVKKGLPAMIEAAYSPDLRSALEEHLEETQNHITRLERVFGVLGIDPDTKDNDIIDELMSAAKDSVSDIEPSTLRDTAPIVNGNQVEHYEIALYGSLASLARQLGLQNAAGPLEETLREEKMADAKLTELGETWMNSKAARHQTA